MKVTIDNKGFLASPVPKPKKGIIVDVSEEIFRKLLTMSYTYNPQTNELKKVSPVEQWKWKEAKKNFLSTFKKRLRSIVWKYFPSHKQNDCALGFEEEDYCNIMKQIILKAKELSLKFEKTLENWNKSNTEAERYMFEVLKHFQEEINKIAKEHDIKPKI